MFARIAHSQPNLLVIVNCTCVALCSQVSKTVAVLRTNVTYTQTPRLCHLRLRCLSVSVKWLAVKTASEMTYTVSSGALNSTPSIHGVHDGAENRIFTARRYVSAVYAMSLCLCLCLSVTSRCSTKTTKPRIEQVTPLDSPGSLVFWRQKSPRNSSRGPSAIAELLVITILQSIII